MDAFIFRLMLSFMVGGSWTTLSTVIAEKFGTKSGGLIAGLPGVVAISLFFIGWTQTPAFVSQATTIIPIVMGINSLFVVVYILVSKLNFYLALASSLALWFGLSLALVLINFDNYALSLVALVVLVISSYFILEKKADIKSEGKRSIRYSGWHLSFRSVFSGAIIALAVLIAEIGGPIWGGIFAVFPAVFLSLMIITYFAQGQAFSSATLKVALLSAAINVTVYASVVRYTYLSFGLIYGTLIAYAVTVLVTYFLYIGVARRIT